MTRRSTPRTPPSRQRSIYEPNQLEQLRSPIPKPTVIERDDSYSSSLYANRNSYYGMQDKSNHGKPRQGSDMEDTTGHSRSPTGKQRYLKKFVNKRTSDAADLLAVYMLQKLSKGLE